MNIKHGVSVSFCVVMLFCCCFLRASFGLEQLNKTAEIAQGLYNAFKGQEEKQTGVDALMKKAKKDGFSQEVQLNALLEYASTCNDPAVTERVRGIIRQQDKKDIKRTIHKWGCIIVAAQLAIGGMIYYLGNRVLDTLEARSI